MGSGARASTYKDKYFQAMHGMSSSPHYACDASVRNLFFSVVVEVIVGEIVAVVVGGEMVVAVRILLNHFIYFRMSEPKLNQL